MDAVRIRLNLELEPEVVEEAPSVSSHGMAGRQDGPVRTGAAADETLDTLRNELARVFEIPADRITPADNLAFLPNSDSLRLMDAIAGTENALSIKIDENDLVSVRTVGELADVFRAGGRS